MRQRTIPEPSWRALQKAFGCSSESKNSSYKMNLTYIYSSIPEIWNLLISAFYIGPPFWRILDPLKGTISHIMWIEMSQQFRA